MPDIATRSGCPIATTLDLVGDKWTLILVRDMLTGKRRYKEFLDSPEGIPTNILANRLRRMEVLGLISRTPYQPNPPRYAYSLTTRGEALLPILQSMCTWANRELRHTWTPPESFMERRAPA